MRRQAKYNIKEAIERELLYIEGFDAGKLNSWKNIFIISFLSTKIIIFKQQNARGVETKRI